MTAFNNGGGDLVATHLPAAILEELKKIEHYEGENNINFLTTLSSNYQSNSRSVSFSGTMEYEESNDGDGGKITPKDYIGVPFNPGTDGDLTATTHPGALYQLLNLAISAQAAAGVNAITVFSQNNITKVLSYTGSISIEGVLDPV